MTRHNDDTGATHRLTVVLALDTREALRSAAFVRDTSIGRVIDELATQLATHPAHKPTEGDTDR